MVVAVLAVVMVEVAIVVLPEVVMVLVLVPMRTRKMRRARWMLEQHER